jgi:hypothetical protein
MNLYDSLNISENDPPAIDVDLSSLTIMEHTGKNYTGQMLNTLYANSTTNRQANNDWMVVKWNVESGGRPFDFNKDGNGFSGKMVLILDNQSTSSGQYATQFFESTSSGISLIILENGASAQNFGNNGLIRGLIVNRGSGNLNLQTSGKDMKIDGAVYNVGTGEFRLEGGSDNKITINYNPEVLRQIMDDLPGVVEIVGSTSVTTPPKVSKVKKTSGEYYHVETELLSRGF